MGMFVRMNNRRVQGGLLCAGLFAATLAVDGGVAGAAEQTWPAAVQASYEVHFNGLKVGEFEFKSTADARRYTVESTGKVAVLLGAMKWTSGGTGQGTFVNSDARSERFGFALKGPVKGGTTEITFAGGRVADVKMDPPAKIKPDTYLLKPEHLNGVLDPFAAVLAMTKGGANPCSRTIPVFDGVRRMDIKLSPGGQVPLTNAKPSDVPTTGIVCKLSYKLIAGHRPGDETVYMNRNQNIEVVFRAVPSANIYVPYQVSASTVLGKISIFARRVSITSASAQQLVLLH